MDVAHTAALPDTAAAPPLTALRHKHLLGIADLSAEEIVLVLDTAEAMKEVGRRTIKKVPTLRGRTVINLFFEPSTRTRTSFRNCGEALSADTLNVAIASSSVVKGETLVDTAMNLEAMSPSMIVLRHCLVGRLSPAVAHLQGGDRQRRRRHARAPDPGAARRLHHPRAQGPPQGTQDRHRRRPAAQPRAAIERAAADQARRRGLGVRAGTLIPPGMQQMGVRVTTKVDEAVEGADVIMMLRIQLERMQGGYFPSLREYFTTFGMTEARVQRAKPDAIIMHPGPINRGVEIASEVA
jgi:aspartate carbamoyltransferase catalytic subunit